MSDRQTVPTKDATTSFVQQTTEQVKVLQQRPIGAPNGLIVPGGGAGTRLALPLAAGVTAGSPVPQYTMDADGFVHLSGVLNTPSGFAVPATFATLPAGYRPSGQAGFVVWSGNSGGSRAPSIAHVDTSGLVVIESVGGLAGGTYFFAADAITFYAGGQ